MQGTLMIVVNVLCLLVCNVVASSKSATSAACAVAFVPSRNVVRKCRSASARLATTPSSSTNAEKVASLQKQIEDAIANKQDPNNWILQLEQLSKTKEPNRSENFLGEWHVWYTDCPPPSNGQLGPFQGSSGQVIDGPATRSYKNLLKVPPNDWLTATLDGIWEEWDGTYLDATTDVQTKSTEKKSATDWGANHWKVTFIQLQIGLLGFPIVTKQFPPNTSRIWRTTYLDDEIRVVRAGQTGRVDDEYVFYTRRTAPK